MRPELLAAKSRVDDQLRTLDRDERALMSETDLEWALGRITEIATERAALTAQSGFLQRTMDHEHARDEVELEVERQRIYEDREQELFDASRRNKQRAEDGLPVLRDVGGVPGPGTWVPRP